MKNILLIFCCALLFSQCKKEVDGPSTPPPDVPLLEYTVVDSAVNPNTFPDLTLELDGDSLLLSDATFHIWKSFSTAGADFTAFYPGEVFYEDKWASIETKDYSSPPNITWDSLSYKQVQVFNLGDTIGNTTNLTQKAFLTDYKYSNTQGVAKIWTRLDNLVGSGKFYIGVKRPNGLAWIEVEVLEYESLMVYSYYFVSSDDSNYIIAGEVM